VASPERLNIEHLKQDRDVDGLIRALADADPQVRQDAALALGEIGDARAVEPLLAVMSDTHEVTEVRNNAQEALRRMGPAAVRPLIRALKDGDVYARTRAAVTLGDIGDPAAVEALVVALRDGDRYVRRYAAESLGKIPDARAVEPLIAALKDREAEVCARAAWALRRVGGPQADAALAGYRPSSVFSPQDTRDQQRTPTLAGSLDKTLNPEPTGLRLWLTVLAVVLGFVAVGLAAAFAFVGILMGISWIATGENPFSVAVPDEAIVKVAAQVCSKSQGVSQAAEYDDALPGPHPVLVLASSGKEHKGTNHMPGQWLPKTIEALELVACVGEDEAVEAGRCYAENPMYYCPMYEYRAEITVRRASTAEVIASGQLHGGTPDCPSITQYGEAGDLCVPMDIGEWVGHRISGKHIKPWLEDYVYPTGQVDEQDQ